MGTKQENAEKREENIEKMEAQIKAWTTQLDELVVGYLRAGAQSHDPYHIRVDEVRTRLGAVQAKLNTFSNPSGEGGAWGTFRAAIKDEWTALDHGVKDLTRGHTT